VKQPGCTEVAYEALQLLLVVHSSWLQIAATVLATTPLHPCNRPFSLAIVSCILW
jgi:hypothetical protein